MFVAVLSTYHVVWCMWELIIPLQMVLGFVAYDLQRTQTWHNGIA